MLAESSCQGKIVTFHLAADHRTGDGQNTMLGVFCLPGGSAARKWGTMAAKFGPKAWEGISAPGAAQQLPVREPVGGQKGLVRRCRPARSRVIGLGR